jgi:putative transposase
MGAVSRTAYYRFVRGDSYQPTEQKKGRWGIFWQHKRRYGSRWVLADLRAQGYTMGRHQVCRLMQQQSLKAIQSKSFLPLAPIADTANGYVRALCRGGSAHCTQSGMGSDFTAGKRAMSLSRQLDRFILTYDCGLESRKKHARCFNNQCVKTGPQHTPASTRFDCAFRPGGQYVSDELREVMHKYHIRQSMSRADNPYDNAFAESFGSRFKAEVLEGGALGELEDFQTEIFAYIEMYYNRVRKYSELGYKSPLTFKSDYYTKIATLLYT